MLTACLIIIIFLLFTLSVRAKIRFYRLRGGEEAVASPVSRALAELVAIAGGIYLSLVLLFNFLKINLPATVTIGGLMLDPLAVVALLAALVQPLLLSIWPRLRGR